MPLTSTLPIFDQNTSPKDANTQLCQCLAQSQNYYAAHASLSSPLKATISPTTFLPTKHLATTPQPPASLADSLTHKNNALSSKTVLNQQFLTVLSAMCPVILILATSPPLLSKWMSPFISSIVNANHHFLSHVLNTPHLLLPCLCPFHCILACTRWWHWPQRPCNQRYCILPHALILVYILQAIQYTNTRQRTTTHYATHYTCSLSLTEKLSPLVCTRLSALVSPKYSESLLHYPINLCL